MSSDEVIGSSQYAKVKRSPQGGTFILLTVEGHGCVRQLVPRELYDWTTTERERQRRHNQENRPEAFPVANDLVTHFMLQLMACGWVNVDTFKMAFLDPAHRQVPYSNYEFSRVLRMVFQRLSLPEDLIN